MAVLNNDRALLLKHMQLATKTIRQLPQVDENNVAAIGFCFGGKCVLDLARSGADIRAVVSFHGIYDRRGWPVRRRLDICRAPATAAQFRDVVPHWHP